jgi:hypothetical protein
MLEPSLRDIEEAIADFRGSSFQSCESVLLRVVNSLDEEPLVSFLRAVLPSVQFDRWNADQTSTVGGMVGSGALTWPPERAERVALQIALCRAIVEKQVRFFDFVHEFLYAGRDLQGHVDAFATKVLLPMLRDIVRITESRVVPTILLEAMRSMPTSGDSILDALLEDARLKFRDASPNVRLNATEKLWDAWERLKSVEVQGNKRVSVARLLDQCSPEPNFRKVLEVEAQQLTTIGNDFHIRHFETDKTPLVSSAQNDYLFHRLFALIHLLLLSRSREEPDT